MFRAIARWYISRSIDDNSRRPAWLSRWIERDEELKLFESRSRQLGEQLKYDAARLIGCETLADKNILANPESVSPMSRAQRRRQQSLIWAFAAALVSCLVIVLTRLDWNGNQAKKGTSGNGSQLVETTTPEPNSGVPESPDDKPDARMRISPGEIKSVVRAWKTGQNRFDQLQARARKWPEKLHGWTLPTTSSIVEPATVVRSKANDTFVNIDQRLIAEQKQLTAELKNAFTFFAYRLPSSVAKLMDLDHRRSDF